MSKRTRGGRVTSIRAPRLRQYTATIRVTTDYGCTIVAASQSEAICQIEKNSDSISWGDPCISAKELVSITDTGFYSE